MRSIIVFAAILVACGGDGDGGTTPPPPPPAVASIAIAPGPTVTLMAGATLQLTATPRDAQGNALGGRTVTWNSGAISVATVSGTGLVTAVSAGTAQLTATSEGVSAQVVATITANPWTTTGSLMTGRTLHSATLLGKGRVLVTGGQSVGPPFQTFASSELYDPVSGVWSATGALATARENHFAVRLANGKVLVAGGVSIELQTRLKSAELYDPTTGTWSATGAMSVERDMPAAVVLADGRVLVVGGSGVGPNMEPLASAEVYDVATGTWSPAGAMTVARSGHTASLLPDGRVLVAGGSAGTFASPVLHAFAEVYNPAAGTWSAAGTFSPARAYHRVAVLANGRQVITGGSNGVSAVFGATDVFDPVAGTWTASGAMASARISHSASVIAGGRILVAGGGGTSGPFRSAELFNPTTGTWSPTADLSVARSNHAAVILANGRVLVVGGQGVGAPTSAELFDPGVLPAPASRVR